MIYDGCAKKSLKMWQEVAPSSSSSQRYFAPQGHL